MSGFTDWNYQIILVLQYIRKQPAHIWEYHTAYPCESISLTMGDGQEAVIVIPDVTSIRNNVFDFRERFGTAPPPKVGRRPASLAGEISRTRRRWPGGSSEFIESRSLDDLSLSHLELSV